MPETMLRSSAILSLGSCLSSQPLLAAPGMTKAAPANSTGANRDIDLKDLFQHWVHSSEEERPGEAVQNYLPADSIHFPPSRFRMAYRYAPNAACEYYFLSPDDAHHFRPCRWTISVSDKVILRISAC